MAVKHIVLLKLLPGTPSSTVDEFIAQARTLPTKIRGILSYDVEQDLRLTGDSNSNVCIVAKFENVDAYKAYSRHPENIAAASIIKPHLTPEGRAAVQLADSTHISLLRRPYDWPLILLYGYFIFSCVFIESKYCLGSGPMDPLDTRFMMPETYEFSVKYNPLFVERPLWLRTATCFSAYGFLPFHFTLLAAFLFGINSFRSVAFVFAGMKIYALGFYHFSEFTSHKPPPELLPYWAPEGPYLIALAATLWRMRRSGPFSLAADRDRAPHLKSA